MENRQKPVEATIEEADYLGYVFLNQYLLLEQVENGDGCSGQSKRAREKQKLGENSVASSGNGWAYATCSKLQFGPRFWLLVIFKFWTAFQ